MTITDTPTGLQRLLSAAEDCRVRQDRMDQMASDMRQISKDFGEVKQHAAAVSDAAKWMTSWTWRGGLVAAVLLSLPSLLFLGFVTVLLGHAGELAAIAAAVAHVP